MRFKVSLVILGLYFILVSLTGCETVKGVAKGGAEGFSNDYTNISKHIKNSFAAAKKADKWIEENLW